MLYQLSYARKSVLTGTYESFTSRSSSASRLILHYIIHPVPREARFPGQKRLLLVHNIQRKKLMLFSRQRHFPANSFRPRPTPR